MKKTSLKRNRILTIIGLLILSIAFFGCNSDDNDEANKTFLEISDNTKWKGQENSESFYFKFLNNLHNPIEVWEYYKGEDQCWDIYRFKDYSFEILENSSEKFVIKFDIDDNDIYDGNYGIWKITRVGNEIKIINEWYRNNEIEDNGSVLLYKTSDNLDSLNLCN